jgi:hypothetical protein
MPAQGGPASVSSGGAPGQAAMHSCWYAGGGVKAVRDLGNGQARVGVRHVDIMHHARRLDCAHGLFAEVHAVIAQ